MNSSRFASLCLIPFTHSSNTGVGIRSTTNLTEQSAYFRLCVPGYFQSAYQAIAESSLAINTFRASMSSKCCSLDLVSMVASYSCFLIPTRHHISLICEFILTQRYAVTVDGVFMVSSNFFWRAVPLKS